MLVLNKIKSYILHKSLNILLLIELLEDLKIKNTVLNHPNSRINCRLFK